MPKIFNINDYTKLEMNKFVLNKKTSIRYKNYYLSCYRKKNIIDFNYKNKDKDIDLQQWIIEQDNADNNVYYIKTAFVRVDNKKYLGYLDKDGFVELFENKDEYTKWNFKTKKNSAYFKLVKNCLNDNLFINNIDVDNNIISYDMFDTLIFRYCNEPHLIFNIIQEKVENPNYKEHRCNAEHVTYTTCNNGNIDAIYDTMKRLYNYDDATIDYYKKTEIETEIENIYPNNELFLKLKENDIIVSDMYLKEEHLRSILKKCVEHNKNIYGNEVYHVNIKNVKIYVSSGGKALGWIWNNITEKNNIKYHIGDNYHSDYEMAIKCGIEAVHYKGTPYSERNNI